MDKQPCLDGKKIMQRRFSLSEDNKPISSSFSVEIQSGVTQYTLTTGVPVSWAIVSQSNVLETYSNTLLGPFPHTPTVTEESSGEYDIQTITGIDSAALYELGSLMVFYNGQLMTRAVEYNEEDGSSVVDRHSFTFDVAELSPLPATTDQIVVSYKQYIAVSGEGSVSISSVGLYPENPTGILVDLTGFTAGETVAVNVIYR